MIVCHCWGITDRDICRLADERARCSGDAAAVIPAGNDCGTCRPLVEALLAKSEGRQEHHYRTTPELVDA
ncbi:MAG TPA: (2Fe-2S)-binding protein [Vicinamibacteria bacterium]|nr:(2Fe-2S)-binding protein [Vicinamibacteria bacterium]